MRGLSTAETLRQSLDEALDLLKDYSKGPGLPEGRIEPLPSLLAQCEELCTRAPEPEPLRSIHHFACTGGSLIAKCIAAMPNVTLLSEIDPLSDMALKEWGRGFFFPTDLIYSARAALRPVSSATVERVFDASVRALYAGLCETGGHLVLRDHAHSQFCTGVDPSQRPTLREMLQNTGLPVRSVITVRHPLDSFLSLGANNWKFFSRFTLEEYARRYRVFLDRHAGLQIFRYEDLVDGAESFLEQLCAALALPFAAGAESLIGIVPMSGDSGRRADRIGHRPRRAVPEEIRTEAASSPAYAELCQFLGYRPDPD